MVTNVPPTMKISIDTFKLSYCGLPALPLFAYHNKSITNGNQVVCDQGICDKQEWLKSSILGRGSNYKDLIYFALESRGGGSGLVRNFDISLV